jgi:hypothetical protein
MFDWLIVALGGHTKSERELHSQLVDNWRVRCLAAETTVELVKEILQKERERGERLMSQQVASERGVRPPEMKPVGNSVSSWPRIKRELERLNRVNDNAEISREEIEKAIRSEE